MLLEKRVEPWGRDCERVGAWLHKIEQIVAGFARLLDGGDAGGDIPQSHRGPRNSRVRRVGDCTLQACAVVLPGTQAGEQRYQSARYAGATELVSDNLPETSKALRWG